MKLGKIVNNPLVKSILIALLIVVILIFAVNWWLSVYTKHGDSVRVPDVKGLQVEDAAPIFANASLKYQVVDSVFNRDMVPGAILETIPPIGTSVKNGRSIFVTINSFTANLLTVPDVTSLSQRQAIAILEASGFKGIQIKQVPGAYRDLVLGIESSRGTLTAGQRVSMNSRLTLLVSSGENSFDIGEDSLDTSNSVIVDGTPEETWD